MKNFENKIDKTKQLMVYKALAVSGKLSFL